MVAKQLAGHSLVVPKKQKQETTLIEVKQSKN